MCSPTALIVGMSVGSSLMGIQGQNQAATSQAQALAGMAQAQVRSDLDILTQRTYQESAKITMEQVRRMRQAEREKAVVATRVADSGLGGGSTLRDAVALSIQEMMDVGTLETSRDWMKDQMVLEKRGAVVRGQSTMNQAQGMLDSRTSGAGGILHLISAGVSGYAQGQQLERMKVGGKKGGSNSGS